MFWPESSYQAGEMLPLIKFYDSTHKFLFVFMYL